jgi:hypothetical protein
METTQPQPSAPNEQALTASALPDLNAALKPPSSHGRNGKVARLPKATRERINTMIEDGVPYLKIIESLGPEGHGLSENSLSTWKAGGYLDWQRQQQLAKVIESKHQLSESIVARAGDDNAAGQAILQVIATNLCEFLVETDPTTLRESLLEDSDKFARFVNSMVRLAEGGIKCEIHKFRAQDRSAQAADQHKPADPPGISEKALLTAEQSLRLL